jgi:hypothetical protein
MLEENKEMSIETSLALLNHRVEVMHDDFTEMRAVLKELTTAINKLTVVEERQTQFAEAQERAFNVIAKIEERLTALEKRVPENDRVKVWVDRSVIAVLGVVFLFVVKKIGLM